MSESLLSPTQETVSVPSLISIMSRDSMCYKIVKSPRARRSKLNCTTNLPLLSKLCESVDCLTHARSGGLCILHGGGLRCADQACERLAVRSGRCIRHGGGRKCSHDGCTKLSAQRGFCVRHGGKRRCTAEMCRKAARKGGVCYKHGVERRTKKCEDAGTELIRELENPFSTDSKVPRYVMPFILKHDVASTVSDHYRNIRVGTWKL